MIWGARFYFRDKAGLFPRAHPLIFVLLFQFIDTISISSAYLLARHMSDRKVSQGNHIIISKDVLGNINLRVL